MMTTEELRAIISDGFTGVNRRIDELRADLAAHRLETNKAIENSNSRVDTLTHWMMTSMIGAIVAIGAAIASWFSPKH